MLCGGLILAVGRFCQSQITVRLRLFRRHAQHLTVHIHSQFRPLKLHKLLTEQTQHIAVFQFHFRQIARHAHRLSGQAFVPQGIRCRQIKRRIVEIGSALLHIHGISRGFVCGTHPRHRRRIVLVGLNGDAHLFACIGLAFAHADILFQGRIRCHRHDRTLSAAAQCHRCRGFHHRTLRFLLVHHGFGLVFGKVCVPPCAERLPIADGLLHLAAGFFLCLMALLLLQALVFGL